MENKNICKFNINRSSDLICTDFIYETKNSQARATVSDKYILGVVIKGEGELAKASRQYSISQGCVFFVQKEERFSINGGDDLEYFYICFHGRRADEMVERIGFSDEFSVFELSENYERVSDFAFDCLHKADSENLDILSEAVLLYTLAHLSSSKKPQSDLIAQIVMLTNENFTNASFSLSDLSAELGYDAKYLSFLFKKKKGICFTQYMRDLRIKRAVFLMEQGVVSVKNIAILSGFGDALYFSKIFKKSMGVSPKVYIENLEQQ